MGSKPQNQPYRTWHARVYCARILRHPLYAGKALLAGEISVGAFAAVFGSIGMLFAVMEEIIARHIGNIASNLGKAHNLMQFMELPERGGTESDLISARASWSKMSASPT